MSHRSNNKIMALPTLGNAMTAADFAAYKTAAQTMLALQAKYGWNITIEPTDIRELSVPATRMDNFVTNAHEGRVDFEASLPPDFPKDDYDNDFLLWQQASEADETNAQLASGPHYTAMYAGSQSKAYSDKFYALAKSIGAFNSALATFAKEKLAPFYEKRGNRAPKP